MEQGNYGENFDRGYEEQARPRQQVIVIGEPVPDKRTTKNLAICSLVLGISGLYLKPCLSEFPATFWQQKISKPL